MKKIVRLVFSVVCCCYITTGFAQQIDQTLGKYIAASPDASSIALYQNYPVDHVTGAPSIEIPLFEIQTRVGVIPFKLSYHIGKIKPAEVSGPAGWGWTLSPNMGITRSVRGRADGPDYAFPSQAGTVANHSSHNNSYLEAASKNNIDEQPDDFFYSLLTKSGRFLPKGINSFATSPYQAIKINFIDDNTFEITDDDGTRYRFGKSAIHPADPMAVESSGSNNPPEDRSAWKITDITASDNSEVITFRYGTKKTNIIPSFNFQWKIQEYFINGIDEIPTKLFRANIGFTDTKNIWHPAGFQSHGPGYMTYGVGYNPQDFDFEPVAVDPDELVFRPSPSPYGHLKREKMWKDLNIEQSYNVGVGGVSVSQQLPLTEINFNNGKGKVVFTYQNNQLSTIELYESGVLIKKVTLYQTELANAFEDPTVIVSGYQNLNKRYVLDSVRISGTNDANGLMYKMVYDLTDGVLGGSPFGVYANYNTDFWGFYNGLGLNLIPRMLLRLDQYSWFAHLPTGAMDAWPLDTTSNGGLMTTPVVLDIGYPQKNAYVPNPTGLLRRIYYPTGGFAQFDFETNEYETTHNNPQRANGGGFRVKRIRYENLQGNGDRIVKVYKYGVNEDGLGHMRYKIDWYNFVYQQWIYEESTHPVYGTIQVGNQRLTTVNATPFLNMSFSNGAAILYPEVAEYTYSADGSKPLGKTVYKYIFPTSATNVWTSFLSPIYVDNRDDFKDVLLVSTEHYKYHNNTFTLVEKTTYSHDLFVRESISVAQTFCRYYRGYEDPNPFFQTPPDGQPQFAHLHYDITTGATKLSSVTKTIYDIDNPANIITATTNYTYEQIHLNLESEIVTDSKGDVHKTRYWYPYQLGIPNIPGSQESQLETLVYRNEINRPVVVKKYLNNSLLNTVYQTYQDDALLHKVFAFNFNDAAEEKISINQYDNQKNVVEQQKANDVKEVYLWGYGQRYPVVKVFGADYSSVSAIVSQAQIDNATNIANNDAAVRSLLNNIRDYYAATPEVQVYTYTYKPMVGITSETDPNGRTTYYEYDNFNRLRIVKDFEGRILKQICYNYYGQPENCGFGVGSATAPNWQNTATAVRCQKDINNQNTGNQEREQIDANPLSVTYNQTRWVNIGDNFSACPLATSPIWQNTETPLRCQKNSNGNNTGWQEQEQRDVNPNSPGFGQVRWVAVSNNPDVCPVPLPMMNINANNYADEEGWRVTFTNLTTQEVFDLEIPKTVRGYIGQIRKGLYDVRIYNVNGNAAPNYFYIGGTTTMDTSGLEGIFNNVLFMNSQSWNDHIDVF
jgi:RHS Repeat.